MMKTFEELNVNELNSSELANTNGGIAIIAASIIGFLVGAAIALLTE